MNGKDLLIGLGSISPKYYDEAENDTITEVKRHRTFRRPLLVAAIIALLLMLVGCAVVYVLRLQDMSIGTETYTQTFDDNGKYLDEPVQKTRDVLTLFGHSGDNIQKATAEWFAFLETYDPNGELMDNNPDHPEIPNNYEYNYDCYTLDMATKIDEIAAKYDLKLLEEWLPFQNWQYHIFLEETGISSFFLPDSVAEVKHMQGMLYEPQNFSMEFQLQTNVLPQKIWGSIDYARKDYFPPNPYPGSIDISEFSQWDYTASDGTPLLLCLSNQGRAYIIAEPENAMLILYFDGNFSASAYPKPDEIITKEQLEALADLFNYSMEPKPIEREAVKARLAEAEAAYQSEHTYVPETYGSFTEYLTKSYYIPENDLQYTFYDLTGDGLEELLIGKNGAYMLWVTIEDGKTMARGVIDTYLCEGGVEERYDAFEIYETHTYLAPVSEVVVDNIDVENRTILTVVHRVRDQWMRGENDQPITAEEAQSIIAQYPRIQLEWKPLMDYPLDENGQTLGQYIEAKDVLLTEEEVRAKYLEFMAGNEDSFYTHYRMLDINGDGVEDLLRSGDGEFFWNAFTWRYGGLQHLMSLDFYLCENGVIENVSTRHDNGVEIVGHEFLRITEFSSETLDLVVYNKATASWQTDWWGEEPISEDEANAILAKYPRIDQGMCPISELLN